MPADATVLRERPDRPAAVWFWTAALLLDAAVLIALPYSPWLLAGLLVLTVSVGMIRRPAILAAYLIGGTPLLVPISEGLGTERPAAAFGYILIALVLLVRGWNVIWEPARRRLFTGVIGDPVWRWTVALGLLLWAGLRWTPAPIYGTSKVFLYWLVNVTLASFMLLVLRREEGEEGPPSTAAIFLRSLLWLQLGVAVAAVVNAFTGHYRYSDRLTTLGMNPIWVARHAGLGILCALLLRRLGLLSRRAMWPMVALFAWVLLESASRGPTLSLAAALIVGYVSAPARRDGARDDSRGRRLVKVFLGAVGLALPALLLVTSGEHAAGQTISNQIRLWLLRAARRALDELSLLGLGPGGFSAFLGLPDRRWYPHNLFIEVTIENGLLGLALLIGFLAAVVLAWRRWGRSLSRQAIPGPEAHLCHGLGMVFLFVLLCAQFSGDIYVNEWVWAFAGVIAAWAPPAASAPPPRAAGSLRQGDDGNDERGGRGER